eukprot:944914-Prorocentrum_minimum.AAC.2
MVGRNAHVDHTRRKDVSPPSATPPPWAIAIPVDVLSLFGAVGRGNVEMAVPPLRLHPPGQDPAGFHRPLCRWHLRHSRGGAGRGLRGVAG